MPHFGIPRREPGEQARAATQLNWRRGLFRLWLLLSLAWIMGWIVYLILVGITGSLQTLGDFLSIPVILLGPPIALLLFGLVAGWAVRGFKTDNDETAGQAMHRPRQRISGPCSDGNVRALLREHRPHG